MDLVELVAVGQQEVIAASGTTTVLQYITMSLIVWLYIVQVPLFVGMILTMGYEWILGVFMSFAFLFFPSLNILFMFSPSLKSDLLTTNTAWSVWFVMLFEMAILAIFTDLYVGDFASIFEIPTSFWTDLFIWV